MADQLREFDPRELPTCEDLALESDRLAFELDAIVLTELLASVDEELSRGTYL